MTENRPRSASGGRRSAVFPQVSDGPNALAYQNLDVIRKRSRGAEVNNPHAEAIISSWAIDTVGVGITPVFNHQNDALVKELRRHWRNWEKRCDFDGRFNLAGRLAAIAQSMVRDGETLVRRRTVLKAGIVSLELEQLEADHLQADGAYKDAAGRVTMGVEFNTKGKRAAYHLLKQHPDEMFQVGRGASYETERVPADQIIHAQRTRRPKETRSLPWLTPTLPRLSQLDAFDDAVGARMAIASSITGVIKGAADADPLIPVVEGESTTAADGRFDGEIEAGTLVDLGPGEEIEFADLPDMGLGYEEVVNRQLKSVAVGSGRTSWSVDGNYAEVNYTSIRAGQNNVQRGVEAFQWNCFIPQVCEPIFEWFMTAGVLDGTFSRPLVNAWVNAPLEFEVEWVTHGFPWVDPLKESLAATNDVKQGFNSRRRVVASRGDQVEDIDNELADDQKRAEGLNLELGDPKPGAAAPAGKKKAAVDLAMEAATTELVKEILQ